MSKQNTIKQNLPKTVVPALDRSVAILELVSQSNQSLTAAEIVRTLAIPRSSGHAILAALVEHNLLHKSIEQRYTLGSQVMHWAGNFLAHQDIVTAFQNEIITVPELSRFSLTLSIRQEHEVICLACRNGNEQLGFTFSIGLRLPAGFAATGMATLSTLTDTEVRDLYDSYWHPAMTKNSMPNCNALVHELAVVRQRGYSIDDCYIRDGMFCIGVPVFDHTNRANNGIALSMQKIEENPEQTQLLGQQLRNMADNLSRRLGATIISSTENYC